MDFTGKRVLVAGGSKGIGRGIALGFAQAGAAVSICARGAAALDATRAELAACGVARRTDAPSPSGTLSRPFLARRHGFGLRFPTPRRDARSYSELLFVL